MKVEQNIFQNSVRQWMLLKIHALPFLLTKRLKADALKRLQILMRKLQTEQVRMMQNKLSGVWLNLFHRINLQGSTLRLFI